MTRLKRIAHARVAAAAIVLASLFAVAVGVPVSSGATPSLGQLNSNLAATQARAQDLSASVSHLSGVIGSLSSQITFVQQREATVRAELAGDRASLARASAALKKERHKLNVLVGRLQRHQSVLADQLVSNYENDNPDLLSVLLSANGFSQLVDQLNYLKSAEGEQQSVIGTTRVARNQVHAATVKLAHLQTAYKAMTLGASERVNALAGMNSLLSSRESALQQARSAQQAALAATQAHGQSLQAEISHVQAAQLAAQQAAVATSSAPVSTSGGAPTSSAPPSGGWAIPAAIVMCESGGQNLPPNSAGASGYYQIIPSTWALYGGSGPAAWLAPLSEQSAVAARIWDGGLGWRAWVCAQKLGIH